MARRSKDNGSCLGTIILIILIMAFIGWIGEYIPYIAIIGGCVFLIWIISKIINSINNRPSNISSQTASRSTVVPATQANNSVSRAVDVDDADVCLEVDTNINEIFQRRDRLEDMIKKIRTEYRKNNRIWNKNKYADVRRELQKKLDDRANKLASTVFVFSENNTDSFENLKNTLLRLDKSEATGYEGSPAIDSVFYDYNAIGDMEYMRFDVEPICISLRSNIFCLTPHYIVLFSQNGRYLKTFKTAVFEAQRTNSSWTERVSHTTWAHTRVDGMPDRRYSYNPRRVYYTNEPRHAYNLLGLRLPGYEIKYAVGDSLRDSVINSVRDYARTQPEKRLDTVYHIIRLIKSCEPEDTCINDIRDTIDYQLY